MSEDTKYGNQEQPKTIEERMKSAIFDTCFNYETSNDDIEAAAQECARIANEELQQLQQEIVRLKGEVEEQKKINKSILEAIAMADDLNKNLKWE